MLFLIVLCYDIRAGFVAKSDVRHRTVPCLTPGETVARRTATRAELAAMLTDFLQALA